jgi:hypothetical protein
VASDFCVEIVVKHHKAFAGVSLEPSQNLIAALGSAGDSSPLNAILKVGGHVNHALRPEESSGMKHSPDEVERMNDPP